MARARVVPQSPVIAASQARTHTTIRLGLVTVVCAFMTAACGVAKAPQRPVQTHLHSRTSSASTPHAEVIGEGSSFQTYASARFHFLLPLADGASFHVDDQTDRWFVATHSATTSTLLVRAWREYEIMNRDSCEARARLYRALPERDRGVRIEQRRIDVPPEHDTIVDVRVVEHEKAPRFEGTVLAFGGWAHGCFAFVFVTRGDDETTVAARLSTIVHGSLERMKFDSDLVPKRTPPDLKTPLRLEADLRPIR